MSLKKDLIKLMEDVDMGYESPFEANSGNGITKFAPTPAAKVLKSYQVDSDFLRRAIGHGGVDSNAVDQIMGGIDGQQVDGPLNGSHFDTVLGAFGVGDGAVQTSGMPPISDAIPNGTDPSDGQAPIDMELDIDPATADIGTVQPSIPGVPTNGFDSGIEGQVGNDPGSPVIDALDSDDNNDDPLANDDGDNGEEEPKDIYEKINADGSHSYPEPSKYPTTHNGPENDEDAKERKEKERREAEGRY